MNVGAADEAQAFRVFEAVTHYLPLYMGLSVASPFRMGRSNGVAWEEARRFAAWAGCRLPTEAEWEYACRAGTPDPRYGDIERTGWYRGNSGAALHPVGEKEPNAWGFYDMLGNAWEWVEDDFHSGYTGAPDDGRAWCDAPRQPRHVLRGGSLADAPHVLRAAIRLNDHPGPRIANVGFRLARSSDPT